MTLRGLSQLYHLNREIERDKARLAELRASAYAASSPNLSGEGIGGGIGDRVGRYGTQIADFEKRISEKIERCMHERDCLERYIADIPDSLTRQIFALRFVNGLSWIQVAFSIGGNTTEDSVKKICYRYIKKTAKK